MMDNSAPSEYSRSSRISCEYARPVVTRRQRSVSFDVFSRPTAALAQHQIHQLSDIGEASTSSRQSHLKVRHSIALAEGISTDLGDLKGQTDTKQLNGTLRYTPILVHASPGGRTDTLHNRLGSHATSALSLPLFEIPERRSSISVLSQTLVGPRCASIHDLSQTRSPLDSPHVQAIALDGRAQSPVRQSLERGAQSSDALRPSSSPTFVRTTPPYDILDNGSGHHQRIQMSLRLPAPLFVGGGTIEGQIELNIDPDLKKKTAGKALLITRLAIDVIGVEEINDGKRHVFLSLASELLDEKHPPPPALVKSHTLCKGSELFWETKRAKAVIPFCIHLPLKLGPPPYLSKTATIRYLLCPTATFKIGKKQIKIRQTWNVQMVTVHDPERALGSLPSPLLASDTLIMVHSPEQSIKITAGLHRQTWVNGSFLFADLHIVNNSAKTVKKIQLILEKTTLFYSHTAAGTAEKSASHLRLPKRNETEIVSSNVIKKSRDWKGVQPHSSEVRTCELELPQGHVTISSGRYFEVRYYVRVVVTLNLFKSLAVQLPITIIHMNSLDVLPNALAQVAASVEAKRMGSMKIRDVCPSHEPYHPGQAFTAAMRQSLEKQREAHSCAASERSSRRHDLDNSPKRCNFTAASRNVGNRLTSSADSNAKPLLGRTSIGSHHHLRRHPSCYHCHLAQLSSARPDSSGYQGPRLPRLQVSTSGLGFSETEFEVPPDTPPKKVMLSEQERKMINQQRELKLQRQWSLKNARDENHGGRRRNPNPRSNFVGYKNVATQYKQTQVANDALSTGGRENRRDNFPSRTLSSTLVAHRARRQTAPDRLKLSVQGTSTRSEHDDRKNRLIQSIDCGERRTRALDPMDDGAVFGNPTVSGGLADPKTSFVLNGIRPL